MNLEQCHAFDCNNTFVQNSRGRKRRYCSGACTARMDYYRHHNRRLELKKSYGERNRKALAAKARLYRALHREETNRTSSEWHKANPERSRQRGVRRYIRKLGLLTEMTLTDHQWGMIKAHWNFSCAYCGVRTDWLTQDHLIPLSKGGPHTADNIVPACKSCNSSKGDKDLIDFLRERAM